MKNEVEFAVNKAYILNSRSKTKKRFVTRHEKQSANTKSLKYARFQKLTKMSLCACGIMNIHITVTFPRWPPR